MAETQKVEIGFEGGQVVAVRLSAEALKDLRKQVEKGELARPTRPTTGPSRSTSARSAFLRIDSGAQKVGF